MCKMDKLFTLGGYDVYNLDRETCRKYGRIFPCLCAWYSSWDDEMDGEERTPNNDECEFETVQEAIDWCIEYRCRRIL